MARANDRISPSLLPVGYWLDLSGKLMWEAAIALLPISYPTCTAYQLHGMKITVGHGEGFVPHLQVQTERGAGRGARRWRAEYLRQKLTCS